MDCQLCGTELDYSDASIRDTTGIENEDPEEMRLLNMFRASIICFKCNNINISEGSKPPDYRFESEELYYEEYYKLLSKEPPK